MQTSILKEANIATVILASGASTRMKGEDKLLKPVRGRPLLEALIDQANLSQAKSTYVVLPVDTPARHFAAKKAKIILNTSPQEGMSASIRTAVAKLRFEYDALIFLLGDMPEICTQPIDQVINAYLLEDKTIIRAASVNGIGGHPVLFDQCHFEALSNIQGDQGAREIMNQNAECLSLVLMKDDAPLIDLDTQEDWQKWLDQQAGDE